MKSSHQTDQAIGPLRCLYPEICCLATGDLEYYSEEELQFVVNILRTYEVEYSPKQHDRHFSFFFNY